MKPLTINIYKCADCEHVLETETRKYKCPKCKSQNLFFQESKTFDFSKISLPFGKYKGKSIVELSEFNPDYLIWISRWDGLRDPFKTILLKFLKTKTFTDNKYAYDVDKFEDNGWIGPGDGGY